MVPKISFITAVRNRSEELKEMIESLIVQDMLEWEAVIVDDHSDEPIEEVVKSFNDDRITFLKLPSHKKGICYARNMAITHAQSPLMLTADSDDINEPNRARVTYEFMTKGNCDVLYSNLRFFVPDKKIYTKPLQPFNPELFKMINFITNPGTAFRKSKYLEVGGYDPNFSLSEDYDMFLRIFHAGGKFCYTQDILVNYRRNTNSVSIKNFSQMHNFIMKTRIKNHIPPFNIKDVKKYALPEIAEKILTEDGIKLWKDDRF